MSLVRIRRDCGDRGAERGQSLVEFALLVPVFLLLLLGMLEFGYMFLQNQTLESATREGARAGAALGNGNLADQACVAGGGIVGSANVDSLIIDAVQRVLKSPGSQVDESKITQILIFKADSTGNDTSHNQWKWAGLSQGSAVQCQSPAFTTDFKPTSDVNWPAANRMNGVNPDSLGVSITYQYQYHTPLGGILAFLGGNGSSSLTMTDRTVMALEPFNKP